MPESILLRHWEAEGVIAPRRSAGGARLFDTHLLDALTIALECQGAGMTLGGITELLNGDRQQRIALVEAQLDAINRQRSRLARTAGFLEHALTCSHPVIRERAECEDFMATA